jgi:hypothetical protein
VASINGTAIKYVYDAENQRLKQTTASDAVPQVKPR